MDAKISASRSMTLAPAENPERPKRQTRAEVEKLAIGTKLYQQMKAFRQWEDFQSGTTGTIQVITMNEVEEYLAAVPEPARTTLRKIRAVIRAAVPAEATEGISYGMPAFRYKGPLVGYAAFPNHCGLYPMNPAVIVEFQEDLKSYQTSKGAIRFPIDKPLPASLVKKIVKTRIAENENKKRL